MASIHHTDLVESSYQTSMSPITDTNTINKYRQSDNAPLLNHHGRHESSSSSHSHGGHGGGPVTPSAGLAATFQNLVKPFIGAGILALPKAFYEGGLVASIVMMALLALVANYCIRKLLLCADALPNFLPRSQVATPLHRPQSHLHDPNDEDASPASPVIVVPTYREIGEAAFGRLGVFLVDFNLCASQIGFCIAYVSFISSNMSDVIPQLSKNAWVLVLFGGFSILTQIRRIETIAHTSLIGNLVYALSLAIIFYQGFKSHCCISRSSIQYVNWSGLPFLFGTACFALEGAGLILPVKAGMKEPSKFSSLLNSAITLVCMCYIVFASLGYLFFGDNINSEITKNLDPGALADTVKGSLSVSLFFSYGIQMFPVTEMVDQILDDRYFSTSSSADEVIVSVRPSELTGRARVMRVIVHSMSRVLIVAFTAVIAVIFPNFGLIVSLVGALSNSAIAFILPMLFYLKLIVLPEYRRKQSEVGSLALSIRDEWSGDRHVSNASCSPSRSENTTWNTLKPWMLPLTVIVVGIMASILGLYVTIKSAVS